MGSIALSSPHRSLFDSQSYANLAAPGMGGALVPYKYTGSNLTFDVTLAALGAPTAPAWPTQPADAIAVELWASSDAAADGIAFAVRSGQLSNTGVLATNTSNNIGTTGSLPSRYAVAGAHIVVPLSAVGAAPGSTWRVAYLTTAGIKLQGRYISQASNFPYLCGAVEEFLLVGAGAVVQLPTATANKFPTGYSGAVIQVIGAGVRMTVDGTAPTAALGDIVAPGVYNVDQTRHGVSLAAIKFYLPASTFLVGHSLSPAP